jgi:hypothetical protein
MICGAARAALGRASRLEGRRAPQSGEALHRGSPCEPANESWSLSRGRGVGPEVCATASIMRGLSNRELLLRGLPWWSGLETGSSVDSARRGSLPHW